MRGPVGPLDATAPARESRHRLIGVARSSKGTAVRVLGTDGLAAGSKACMNAARAMRGFATTRPRMHGMAWADWKLHIAHDLSSVCLSQCYSSPGEYPRYGAAGCQRAYCAPHGPCSSMAQRGPAWPSMARHGPANRPPSESSSAQGRRESSWAFLGLPHWPSQQGGTRWTRHGGPSWGAWCPPPTRVYNPASVRLHVLLPALRTLRLLLEYY